MRVLIVSEDRVVRAQAASGLEGSPGIELVEASSAPEAHLVIDGGDVDVIVMDGDMSPEGGYSVLYEVRARGDLLGHRTPRTIVLGSRADDRFLADWARADELVVKPIDPFDLAARVLRFAPLQEGLAGA